MVLVIPVQDNSSQRNWFLELEMKIFALKHMLTCLLTRQHVCCAHHCLRTLFWEKEKCPTLMVDKGGVRLLAGTSNGVTLDITSKNPVSSLVQDWMGCLVSLKHELFSLSDRVSHKQRATWAIIWTRKCTAHM